MNGLKNHFLQRIYTQKLEVPIVESLIDPLSSPQDIDCGLNLIYWKNPYNGVIF